MERKFKVTLNSPVILWFVFVCVGALVLSIITGGWTNHFLFSTYRSSIMSPLTYIRLFTHVLGHSSWGHLIGNMSYILIIGPMLEEKYGSKSILKVIIITALITGLINALLFPNTALLGASGVVFAFILLTSFTGFKDGEIPLTFILVAVLYIGQQIYDGIMIQDNVSNLTHIVGGVVGAFIGYNWNKRK